MRTEMDAMPEDYRDEEWYGPFRYEDCNDDFIEPDLPATQEELDEWVDDWPPEGLFDPAAEYKAMLANGTPPEMAARAVDGMLMSFDDYMAHNDGRQPA